MLARLIVGVATLATIFIVFLPAITDGKWAQLWDLIAK
ncbi:hypothetical protein J2X37_000591 [Croceicoccus sp. BE223]|nr:hypothetical protein [Croceicoccus sp. BE223]